MLKIKVKSTSEQVEMVKQKIAEIEPNTDFEIKNIDERQIVSFCIPSLDYLNEIEEYLDDMWKFYAGNFFYTLDIYEQDKPWFERIYIASSNNKLYKLRRI